MANKRILIVDDEKNILKTLESALSLEGYDAVTAGSGAEAIKVMKEKAPDLVILDIVLGDMSGLDVLKKMIWNSKNLTRQSRP